MYAVGYCGEMCASPGADAEINYVYAYYDSDTDSGDGTGDEEYSASDARIILTDSSS